MMKTNMEASQSYYNRKQDYYQQNIWHFKTRKLKDEKGNRSSNEGLGFTCGPSMCGHCERKILITTTENNYSKAVLDVTAGKTNGFIDTGANIPVISKQVQGKRCYYENKLSYVHSHWSAERRPGDLGVMYMCVKGVDYFSFPTILQLYFLTVPTVW